MPKDNGQTGNANLIIPLWLAMITSWMHCHLEKPQPNKDVRLKKKKKRTLTYNEMKLISLSM